MCLPDVLATLQQWDIGWVWGRFGVPRELLWRGVGAVGWGVGCRVAEAEADEPRASCQQLRFTDVSLWLFNLS